MDREKWLAERRTGIGGSDCAAALALSSYKSPYQLWAEKRGLLEDDEPETERMAFGKVMEAVIADRYAVTRGVRVRRSNQILRHPKYPWMIANIDRRIEGERRGLECKNVDVFAHRYGEWGNEEGSDEVPIEYALQVVHYMIVTDLPVFDIAACIGGNRLQVYTIERDAELEELVIDSEAQFWQKVETGEEPEFEYEASSAIGLLKRMHPGSDGTTIELDEGIQHWHEVRLDCAEHIRRYTDAQDAASAHILEAMGNAAIGMLPSGGHYRRKEIVRKRHTVEETKYIDCRFIKPKEPKE
jgi:putative phage-type endonuclease